MHRGIILVTIINYVDLTTYVRNITLFTLVFTICNEKQYNRIIFCVFIMSSFQFGKC